jgi:hypothetical protein
MVWRFGSAKVDKGDKGDKATVRSSARSFCSGRDLLWRPRRALGSVKQGAATRHTALAGSFEFGAARKCRPLAHSLGQFKLINSQTPWLLEIAFETDADPMVPDDGEGGRAC